MKQIRIEKVTLNIGAGKEQNKLDKAVTVIKAVAGIEPKKTVTQKRIAAWGLRPGLPIGAALTLRKEAALKILPRLLAAKENQLEERHFDNQGNISFGIQEHIDITGVEYDPKIGVFGLQVSVTLERPGFHVKRKRSKPSAIGKTHRISQKEAIGFMKEAYKITLKNEATA